MESNEIKEGDVVFLKHDSSVFVHYMTVGKIENDIATCYWEKDHDVIHKELPVSVLKRHEGDGTKSRS